MTGPLKYTIARVFKRHFLNVISHSLYSRISFDRYNNVFTFYVQAFRIFVFDCLDFTAIVFVPELRFKNTNLIKPGFKLTTFDSRQKMDMSVLFAKDKKVKKI